MNEKNDLHYVKDAPKKILQKQQGTMQRLHKTSAGRNGAQLWGGTFVFTVKNLKKISGEYKVEATIQNKIRLDKCDAYTAKETLGYKGRKSCSSSKWR